MDQLDAPNGKCGTNRKKMEMILLSNQEIVASLL